MDRSRRGLVLGTGLALAWPRRVWGQGGGLEREHRIKLDLPILSEEPTAVPIAVGLDHPMEPDHFIRSIEVTAERDPVPDKGTFRFTPSNGRPWVAFQMRSGAGGPVKAVAECSRHGRFTSAREVRVVEGGCTTAPPKVGRDSLGNPMVRLPRSFKPGEIVEVRTKVDHNSYTGLALKDGKFVREAPEFYVRQMLVYVDEEQISEFRMTSAVSPNPLIRFPLKVSRGGTLRVVFTNNEGQRWEATESLRL